MYSLPVITLLRKANWHADLMCLLMGKLELAFDELMNAVHIFIFFLPF